MFKKGIFVKASFMFVTIFLDMKIPGEKTFKPSCPEHPKIIEIKNDKVCFHTFLWCLKKVL